ncbi:MAG TPA: lytic murein transglycosylase [Gaiellaceae bacterium]|nr:lytic murein transglycosylase [Gaiellaceae bacterium]
MSRRTRVLAGLAVAAALAAGAARADTYTLLAAPSALPSADMPNLPGSIVLPASLSTPPARPERLSYPQLEALWRSAGSAYGVPWQVLAAINKVESNYGRNMGPSSAGAIGWMQFMPSTWLRWGVDGNGDGIADPWSAGDAIYAAARYLAASGARSDISRAVYSYNHAQWYVDEVLSLAQLFRSGGPQATVTLDRLQARLSTSSGEVVAASRRLVGLRERVRRIARVEARFRRQAAGALLLSDRLAAQKQAVLLDVRRQALLEQVAAARARLAAAQRRLAAARSSSRAASFQPGARAVLASPAVEGGYVFPVGGGAGVVFASHTHHDYPAVDIAAPLGSPVYALSSGVVLRAWRSPDPRCGIGLTMRAGEGLVWTYCHLAAVDGAIHAGAAVSAGTPVGLVGATGDATGPHLHLQLQPPTEWPQRMPWFQGFAGSAFTWSDGPTPAPTGAPRVVFAVVPQPQSRVVTFTR